MKQVWTSERAVTMHQKLPTCVHSDLVPLLLEVCLLNIDGELGKEVFAKLQVI